MHVLLGIGEQRAFRYDDFATYYRRVRAGVEAITQLMGAYATREDEVDELLRRKVFVNLHTVVRQGLRAGVAELLAQGGGGARGVLEEVETA